VRRRNMKDRKKEEEPGPKGRPGDDDPFPRRSSPTSNWSSDPHSE